MKKLVLFLSVLLSCFTLNIAGPATAEQNNDSVYVKTLSNVANSIVQVIVYDSFAIPEPPFSITQRLGSGSGFVVKSNKEQTIIVTAKHVVVFDELNGVLKAAVELDGIPYMVNSIHRIDDMDAAYLIVEPGILNAKALEFNLDYDSDVTEALAFGFGMGAKIKGDRQKYTFTHGFLSRKVCSDFSMGNKYELVKNVLFGTPTIIFGYSGGPILDLQYRILGINIAIMSSTNIFVDGRAVYNAIYHINNGKKVSLPIDPTFDVFNGHSNRIALEEDKDGVESEFKTFNFNSLRELMNEEAKLPQSSFLKRKLSDEVYKWVGFNTIVKVNGKSYRVREVTVAAKNSVAYRYLNPFVGESNNYVYMCGPGWEVIVDIVLENEKK